MIKAVYFLISVTIFASCKNPSGEHKDDEAPLVEELVSPADSVSAQPFLFTDKNDSVYLSWIEKSAEISSLKFSVLADSQWSEPRIIAQGNNWFVNWADFPTIASTDGHNLLAHFLEKSGESTYAYDIKITTSTDQGASWAKPITLHDDGKQAEHGFVSYVPVQENFFVSWLDGRNTVSPDHVGSHDDGHHGQMTLRAAIVDKSGNKANEWQLDDRVCDCCQTSMAHTSNGPVVVYRDRSDEEIRDISIVRFVDGAWTQPRGVFEDNWEIAGCPVNGPKVVAEDNNLAVAWFSSPGSKAQVKIAFSENGGATFNKPIRIDEGNTIGRVNMVMLNAKTVMVCWMEGSVIKACKVHRDGTKEPAITIASSSEARKSGFPQVAKSGNKLIFAWSDDKEKTIKMASLSL